MLQNADGKLFLLADQCLDAHKFHNTSVAVSPPYVILVKDKPASGHHSSNSNYPISVTASTNGKLTADKSSAVKGATVTLTVAPDKGYELSKLTVTDKDGKEIVLTDKGSNKYTFLMPSGKVSVSAEFAEVKSSTAFVDVPADAYYADAVIWAVKESVTTGTAATAFTSGEQLHQSADRDFPVETVRRQMIK